MIFVDTGLFIALARKHDEKHARAREVYGEIRASGEALFFSESVFGETVSYARRHDGAEAAYLKGKELLEMQGFTMIFQSRIEVEHALQIMHKFAFASYTDALTVSMMQSRGIRKIASFDSEFDKVPGVERIF